MNTDHLKRIYEIPQVNIENPKDRSMSPVGLGNSRFWPIMPKILPGHCPVLPKVHARNYALFGAHGMMGCRKQIPYILAVDAVSQGKRGHSDKQIAWCCCCWMRMMSNLITYQLAPRTWSPKLGIYWSHSQILWNGFRRPNMIVQLHGCVQCVRLTNFIFMFNFKSKMSCDVFKNIHDCQLTSTFSYRMSPQCHIPSRMCHFKF